jgi:hypothetical protein
MGKTTCLRIRVLAACVTACLTACQPVVPGGEPAGTGTVTVQLASGWHVQAAARTRSDVAKVRIGLVLVEGNALRVVAVQEVALMGPQIAVRFNNVPVGIYRAAAVALDRDGNPLNQQGPALSANVATLQDGRTPVLSAGDALVVTVPLADARFASLPVRVPGLARLSAAQLEFQLIDVYGGRIAGTQRVTVGATPPAGVVFHDVPNGAYQAAIIATAADGTRLAQLISTNLALVANQGDSVQWTASDAFAIPLP